VIDHRPATMSRPMATWPSMTTSGSASAAAARPAPPIDASAANVAADFSTLRRVGAAIPWFGVMFFIVVFSRCHTCLAAQIPNAPGRWQRSTVTVQSPWTIAGKIGSDILAKKADFSSWRCYEGAAKDEADLPRS
jgi:hypothetical protein